MFDIKSIKTQIVTMIQLKEQFNIPYFKTHLFCIKFNFSLVINGNKFDLSHKIAI